MASITENTRALPPTTPKRVLAAIHNIPRRMRSGTLRTQPQAPAPAPPRSRTARGKENAPPAAKQDAPAPRRRRPAPLLPKSSAHVFGLGLPLPRDLDTPSPPPSSARFPFSAFPFLATPSTPPSSASATNPEMQAAQAERWAPRGGQIVLKVWVPTTDDIWKVRVPEGARLDAVAARVAAKVGFPVAFSAVFPDGVLRSIADEATFRRWVAGRVREGRNTLLTAHRLGLQ